MPFLAFEYASAKAVSVSFLTHNAHWCGNRTVARQMKVGQETEELLLFEDESADDGQVRNSNKALQLRRLITVHGIFPTPQKYRNILIRLKRVNRTRLVNQKRNCRMHDWIVFATALFLLFDVFFFGNVRHKLRTVFVTREFRCHPLCIPIIGTMFGSVQLTEEHAILAHGEELILNDHPLLPPQKRDEKKRFPRLV